MAGRLRRLVARTPGVGAAARGLRRRVDAERNARALRRLRAQGALTAGLADVLDRYGRGAAGGCEIRARIESERARMAADASPLIDGSLPPGPYDEGTTLAKACAASKSPRLAELLFLLVRRLDPRTVLELGTNVGISGAYLGAALRLNGSGGRLVTLEASPYQRRAAKRLHEAVGLDNVDYVGGLFADTLEGALDRRAPVDLAFIDGHHQHRPTLDYFDAIYPRSAPRAVFVFDDIRWSDGMRRAWAELRADPRIAVAVDLETLGVCLCDPCRRGPPAVYGIAPARES